jgi:hypothetical protein
LTLREVFVLAGAVLAAGAVGVGVGRYSAPAKVVTVESVKTETKTEENLTIRYREGPTRTVTTRVEVEVPCPDGGTVPGTSTTTTVDQGPVTIDQVGGSTSSTNTLAQTTTTITQEQPRWLLQASAASGLDFRPVYSVGLSRRLAGPLWLGLAYRSEQQLELRASLTF